MEGRTRAPIPCLPFVGERATPVLVLSLSCVVLAACGAGSAVEGGIDGLPTIAVTEEMRIGSVDDPDAGFSRLGSVDVDADGNVYALEAMDNQIRVFDRDGRIVRRIGRKGGGPGEFENAPRFGVMGDTLWAFDIMGRRITLFDRSGTVLSTGTTQGVKIPLVRGSGYVMPERMRPDGLFLGWLSMISFNTADPPSGVERGDSIPVPRVLFDATGAVVDTIGWMPSPPPRMVAPPGFITDRKRITVGSREYMVPTPPTELPGWYALADGHLIVDMPYATTRDPATFTITRIDLAGDTVYHRSLDYRPEPFTAEQLDSAAARGARGPVMMGGPAPGEPDEAVVNALRAALDFPPYRLPIRTIWIAQDESVWLLRDDEPGAPARWIVLGPDGATRGELELAARVRPLWNRGETVWASAPDDFDVPWLVRYRIGG